MMIPIILIIIDRSDQHHIHWEPGKEVWQGKWRPGWVSLFCIHLNFFFVLDLFCIHSHWFPFSRVWVWQSLKEMYQWELLCRSRWTFTFMILIFLHWAVMSHDHPHDYDDVKGNQNQNDHLDPADHHSNREDDHLWRMPRGTRRRGRQASTARLRARLGITSLSSTTTLPSSSSSSSIKF